MNARFLTATLGLFSSLTVMGCGDRPSLWDSPLRPGDAEAQVPAYGMNHAVALLDKSENRVVLFSSEGDSQLVPHPVPIGRNVMSVTPSPKGDLLFVLSGGEDQVRSNAEPPSLTIVEDGPTFSSRRVTLPDRLTDLVLDPERRWVIAYAGAQAQSSGRIVTNPNELVFIDITKETKVTSSGSDGATTADGLRTLSLPNRGGGYPQRLTFGPRLRYGNADRRLLLVETDRDLLGFDPENPDELMFTLPISGPNDTTARRPSGIAVYPGDTGDEATGSQGHAPVIAVRTTTDDEVLLFTLETSKPTANRAFVGGIPNDMAFARTNQGVKLAVLASAPSPRVLVIDVDASTTGESTQQSTQQGSLNQAYTKLVLLPPSGGDAGGFDRALLLNGGSANLGVALWDLGKVPDSSSAEIAVSESITTYRTEASVVSVLDVPERSVKILTTSGNWAYLFDPNDGTFSSLRLSSSTAGPASFQVTGDGARAWIRRPSESQLGSVDLDSYHVRAVVSDRSIDAAFEIQRTDSAGHALVMLHDLSLRSGASSATVVSADDLNMAQSRVYQGLLLQGLVP